MESSEEKVFLKLRNFNAVMGVVHLIQGILMLILSNDYTLPIERTFLSYDPVTETLMQDTQTIIDLRIGPLVAIFLFISAVAHFSVSTFGYNWYVRNLKKHINYARWYEYAFSSSIMILIIAMLVGIYELSSLILIFSLNATMNLFGLMMELYNQKTEKPNWIAFIYGSFAGLACWFVLGIYFFGALLTASESVPTFVYFIFVSIAIFFNIFAVNMILQYKGIRKWKDYLYGERVYIILSLTAKSALAWQVFAGTLRGG